MKFRLRVELVRDNGDVVIAVAGLAHTDHESGGIYWRSPSSELGIVSEDGEYSLVGFDAIVKPLTRPSKRYSEG